MSFKEIFEGLPGFINGLFCSTEDNIHRIFTRIEMRISKKGLAIKRFIFRSIIEAFLLIFGIGCLLLGLVILLGRIAPLDFMLIAVGVVLINIVLLTGKFK